MPQIHDLPNLDLAKFQRPDPQRSGLAADAEPARILLLYGSVRERSFSRLVSEEASRLLALMVSEVRTFDPSGLPLPDDAPVDHPKVAELRALVQWSEGMVWCSPERHGVLPELIKPAGWRVLLSGRAA